MNFVSMNISVLLVLICTAYAKHEINLDEIRNSKECRLSTLAEAHRQFAYDLYKRVSDAEGPNNNVLLSPMVVNMGMSMVLMGAAGSSKTDLLTSLNLLEFLKRDGRKEDIACIFEYYKFVNENGPMTLDTASKIFGDKSLSTIDDFLSLTGLLRAKMQQVDFSTNIESARQVINSWVSQQTRDHIPELFPEGSIEPTTKLVLATALYFKGLWKNKFSNNYTSTFQVSQTENVDAVFMSDTFSTKSWYDDINELNFVELPYLSSEGDIKVSMILIQDAYSNEPMRVERKLGVQELQRSLNTLFEQRETKTYVALPMFEVRGDYNLKPHLIEMGMGRIFTGGQADLSGINGKYDLYLSSATHKTYLKVDPEGSEAAAAFGAGVVGLSLNPRMIFNKPFTFMLYEKTTNTSLFMGRIANPNLG